MKLSIVIACYNDNSELAATVASIRATAGDAPEIVVVDDCSMLPVAFLPGIVVIRNSKRIGCGPSRYVGAMRAKGEYLLFCDSHMRFSLGWYEAAIERLRPQVLHCGSCVGLGADMDVGNGSRYYGATFNFHGPDRNVARVTQTMECIWAKEGEGDEYRIAAIMGACYFIHREWFIYLNCLKHLRIWGGDEQELSLKAWLSGGEIRLLKNVRIGHKFRTGKVSSMFVQPRHVVYNKLFVAHTCLPPQLAAKLEARLVRESQGAIAMKELKNDWHLVETMRAYNSKIFEKDFAWYLAQFGLAFPEK